jgi:hypothetical protein
MSANTGQVHNIEQDSFHPVSNVQVLYQKMAYTFIYLLA